MQNEPQRPRLVEINPQTRAAHRREMFRQVILPLTIVIAIVLALVVAVILVAFATRGNPEPISRWADVSLIWLLMPATIIAIILLLVNVGLVFAVMQLLRVLPLYSHALHLFVIRGQLKLTAISDKLAEPFIKVHSFNASLKALGGRRPKR